MTNVLLCGDPSDTSITEALVPALAACGGLCRYGRNQVSDYGEPARFFLYESEEIPKIEMEKGILVLKNRLEGTAPAPVPDHFICVIASGNSQAAQLLCGSGAAVITCGTGPTDTLSLAGIDASSACVSLQRNLADLSGRVLEPHDFSVRLSKERTPEQILTVSAVLLLSGENSEEGYLI